MINTIHERPGVYSSYDASSVMSAAAWAKTVGLAAIASQGTANKAVLLTSLAGGIAEFGADGADSPGMAEMLRLLFANGAAAVKAVAVGEDAEGETDYASAFAVLSAEEDIGVVVCDSAEESVHQALRDAVAADSEARRERIAVCGGANETVAQMIAHAQAINSERVVFVGPDIVLDDDTQLGAVFAAAAVAGVIAAGSDPSVPINGARLSGFGALSMRFSDNELDQLVRGGVTPLECVGGVCAPVRGITTKTSTDGADDATWRELTTILIVDNVIPTIRNAIRAHFSRSKNTAQTRGAIRSQVVLELEDKLSGELIDSYGEVSVSAMAGDPTVCLVEFGFTVAHGLNRVYLSAHITV